MELIQDAIVEPRMDHFDCLHELIHNGHDLCVAAAMHHLRKLSAGIIINNRVQICTACHLVKFRTRLLVDLWLLFWIQVIQDREVRSQFYAGVSVWISLSLTLRYRFP